MWMSQKRTSNQELDICQFRINLEREKEQLLAEAKSEILRHEYRADLAEKNICELKRNLILKQWNWAYSDRVWTVQTRTSSISRTIGRSRTSTSWYLDWKYSKVGRIEEISGISTRIIDKKVDRNLFLKMSNLYAADNSFTFQVNLRYFLFHVNQEDC